MYRSCIFCSGDLGTNEALEEFPVGRSLAFDAWKGRLWAVCPRCCRWNLAPLEERWEAVESAEKRFRDSRLRVQSENVGLCRLPDGTRLVRVGQALPGELAAWRYGHTLVGRRRQYLLTTGALGTGAAVIAGGLWATGAIGAAFVLFQVGNAMYTKLRAQTVIGLVPEGQSSQKSAFTVTRVHLEKARVVIDDAGDPALVHPSVTGPWRGPGVDRSVVVRGEAGRKILARAMVVENARGAGSRDLGNALEVLERDGSAGALMLRLAHRGMSLRADPEWKLSRRPAMSSSERLALEMALHEEQERMAMEGELAGLEAAWREAEEIARIADALPGEPRETGRP